MSPVPARTSGLAASSQPPDSAREDRAAAHALGELVAAIGSPGFPRRLLDALRTLAGVQLCSAFRWRQDGAIELLFAEGEAPDVPGFTLRASHAYARDFWRLDRQIAALAQARTDAPIVLRRRTADIASPAYRSACYDPAAVTERVSILSPSRPRLMLNGYRTAAGAGFSPDDLEGLDLYAGILLASLRQHLGAALPAPVLDEAELAGRLCTLASSLSAREAEIAAGLILGDTQERIAEAKRLSRATVVTYRRRAYGKLGVNNRHDLMALYRRLVISGAAACAGGEGK